MDWIDAIILGIVEGITEYLPVSSTGHLILTSGLLGLNTEQLKDNVDAFTIIIQGGAILAVLGLYRQRVMQMIRGLMGKDAAGFRLLANLFIAFLPAAILGLIFEKLIDRHLFYAGPVIAALAIGGVYMIALEAWRSGKFGPPRSALGQKTIDELTPIDALTIGLFQCVAMIPGTSRSMMTITAGVIVRLSPASAAEFSFLLGLPTLGAATLYKFYTNVVMSDSPNGSMLEQLGLMPVILGIITATISAAIAVKWLVRFLNTHGLAPFGYYRLLLALILTGLILGQVIDFTPADPTPPADVELPAE